MSTDPVEREWIAWTLPITTLLDAGARVRMAPCDPNSTDDDVVPIARPVASRSGRVAA